MVLWYVHTAEYFSCFEHKDYTLKHLARQMKTKEVETRSVYEGPSNTKQGTRVENRSDIAK